MKQPLISCTVKELQNEYAKISQLAKENPVIIKENEQESMVLLAHQKYYDLINRLNELESKLAMYDHFIPAQEDIKFGRTQDIDSAFKDVLKDL